MIAVDQTWPAVLAAVVYLRSPAAPVEPPGQSAATTRHPAVTTVDS